MIKNVNTFKSSAELSGSLAQNEKKVRDYSTFLYHLSFYYPKKSIEAIKKLLELPNSDFAKGLALGHLIASGVYKEVR